MEPARRLVGREFGRRADRSPSSSTSTTESRAFAGHDRLAPPFSTLFAPSDRPEARSPCQGDPRACYDGPRKTVGRAILAGRGPAGGRDRGECMEYRRLGRSGLRVSVLSLGSWVTFGPQLDLGLAKSCLAAARAGGVNFFDNAEQYAGGESERIMGRALAELGWPRHSYVVSTKFFWGIRRGRQHAEHAQPQVPAAGDRRLARAARPRLRRPPLLPPLRPADADRGDGVGDERHRQLRQGAPTGGRRSGRPTTCGPRSRSPNATTCASR